MTKDELAAIDAQARREIEEEAFRAAVERHKQKLREKRTLWDRIFPWKIIVIKKGK